MAVPPLCAVRHFSFFMVLPKPAVKCDAIFAGNFNNADSLVVNLNFLFSVPEEADRNSSFSFCN